MSPARLTFDEAEKALAAFQTRGWRLGLDRMNAFVDELGLRDYVTGPSRPKYFHVAGTNGKGSTTCFLQHLLHEHGFRVGACYSPYVYDVRERVQIGLDLISKDEFAACTEILLAAGEKIERTEFGGPTEFEMKIAMGFLAWQRAGVNAVALETGMGGRLDATNVVDPACSIITSIGLDHTEYLGSTLAEIAGEKAGIIKKHRPVVVGGVPPEAAAVITEAAQAAGSVCWRIGHEIHVLAGEASMADSTIPMPSLAMPGRIQHANAAAALAALVLAEVEIRHDPVHRALSQARMPGRMERVDLDSNWMVLDGAHNEEAAAALGQALQEKYPGQRFGLIWGMLHGHDPASFLKGLKAVVAWISPTEVQISHREAYSAIELAKVAGEVGIPVRESALNSDLPLLVTGSFYLLSQIKAEV